MRLIMVELRGGDEGYCLLINNKHIAGQYPRNATKEVCRFKIDFCELLEIIWSVPTMWACSGCKYIHQDEVENDVCRRCSRNKYDFFDERIAEEDKK